MKSLWKRLFARWWSNFPGTPVAYQREPFIDESIVELAQRMREGELTSRRLTELYLDRIDRLNGELEVYGENGGYNAFVRIDRPAALAEADSADRWINNANDPRGPAPLLCGMPIGVKDSFAIAGRPSKNGAPFFASNIALRDATVVARLREQGAVILGHTHCSRISASTNGDYGTNAWDPRRVPGGSSSGSGIAPIARLCVAALGEETGGSIIIPASVNGASAIKPSLGWVSTAGVMPLRIGWDVVGPMARSIQDASLILSAIQGPDQSHDPQTLDAPMPALKLPTSPSPDGNPLRGITIGIPQTDWMQTMGPPADTYSADHKAVFQRFKSELQTLGASVIEFEGVDMRLDINKIFFEGEALIEIGTTSVTPAMAASYLLHYQTDYWEALADFASALAEPDKSNLLGAYDLEVTPSVAAQIPYAVRVQAEYLRRDLISLWQESLDAQNIDFMLVLPVGEHVGYRFNEDVPATEKGIRNGRSAYDLPNALGWPMVTFPIGHGTTGVSTRLPINAAFWGPRFSEPLLIQAAMDFQHHYPEHHQQAPLDATLRTVVSNAAHIWPVTPHTSTDPLVKEGSLKL